MLFEEILAVEICVVRHGAAIVAVAAWPDLAAPELWREVLRVDVTLPLGYASKGAGAAIEAESAGVSAKLTVVAGDVFAERGRCGKGAGAGAAR